MKLEFATESRQIIFYNEKHLAKYSVHLWRQDDLYKNNKQRVAISGWVSDTTYQVDITEPGTYFANIYIPEQKQPYQKTQRLPITMADLMQTDNKLSDALQKSRETSYDVDKLLQQLYIIGPDFFNQFLLKKLGSKRLNVVTSAAKHAVTNTIFAGHFFEGKLPRPRLFSAKTEQFGYLFSMTFRSETKLIKQAQLTQEDMLIVVDSFGTKKYVDEAINSGAIVYKIADLVQEAFVSKYLVEPLATLPNRTIYIQFPLAKDVINPTPSEIVAAKTTIREIRANAAQNRFPAALSEFDNDYNQDVVYGWQLDNHEGYDTLVDYQSAYANVHNGQRLIPENGDKMINGRGIAYFFGNSVMYGIGSDDSHTIPALFAQNSNLTVENKANFSMNDFVRATNYVQKTDFNEDDVVIFGSHIPLNETQRAQFDLYLNAQELFNHPRGYEQDVFLDVTHLNKYGYQIIADKLWEIWEQ